MTVGQLLAGPRIRQLQIVEYESDFREQVVSLWRHNFKRASVASFERDIDVAVGRHPQLFLLAASGPALLGTCLGASDGHRGWIYYMCVERRHRRAGIATALLAELERRMRAAGVVQASLHVSRHGHSAQQFYRSSSYFREDVQCLGKRLQESD